MEWETKMRVEADWFVKDKTSAAEGIRRAIAYAKETGAQEIHFSRGEYFLTDTVTIQTKSIAHDDGCGDIHEKDCYLVLEDVQNLKLVGEAKGDGSPATCLTGCHPYKIQALYPSLLWAERGTGLTIENLAFRRRPATVCSGVVEHVEGDCICVRPFPGLDTQEEMGAYCMNRFDLKSGALLGESLTFGFGFDKRWKRRSDGCLLLRDGELARRVKAGEGLSFHGAGKTDFLIFFGEISDLSMVNVRVYNTNSFALLTENCCHIRAEKLCIRPEERQLFTGPRDGWKVYRCSGNIWLNQCHFEGLRMDAQNVHSNYLIADRTTDERTLLCTCKYAPISLKDGAEVRIHGRDGIWHNRIKAWTVIGGRMEESVQSANKSAGQAAAGEENHITCYRIEFEEDLGGGILPGTLLEPLCWEPESYTCINSVFRNIAGAGNLIRCGNVRIENNHYENLMNAGVLIGAEFDTHCESGHGHDILIQNNHFINIGFKPRYGEYGCGCIAVKSQGFEGPFNSRIKIEGNCFENSGCAIELNDCREVEIKNNVYTGISRRLIINEKTVDTESITADVPWEGVKGDT